MNVEFNVSVIIPVYNAEKYIRKAVESVATIGEVKEIILIEDGSPDSALVECRKLVEEYEIVRLLQHPDGQNRGAGASRNLGILNAQFDFVAFLDADDVYLPNRFFRDQQIFLSDVSVDGVYNAIAPLPLDENGVQRMNNKSVNSLITLTRELESDDLFEYMEPIGNDGFFSMDGLTIKKSVFLLTGLMNTKLLLSQDTHLCIKLAAVAKLRAGDLKKAVALYGMHSGNRSQFSEKLTANRPYLFYDLYKWAISKKLSRSRIYLLWQRFYQYHLLVNKPNRRAQLMLLGKEGINNPSLFKSTFFLKQLPLLHRLIS
jgi:glycosyltransferase involved in cell wall biosynthesis